MPGTEYADSLLDYPEWRLTKGGNVQVAEIEAGKVAGDELQVKFAHINDAATKPHYCAATPSKSHAKTLPKLKKTSITGRIWSA